MGGNYTVEVSRETTTFTLTILPEYTSKAVKFLSDIVLNPLLNGNQIEAEKPELYKNAVENHRDQMDVTLENAHFTVLNIKINKYLQNNKTLLRDFKFPYV